jgi:methionine-rich copper-binding protein CopC
MRQRSPGRVLVTLGFALALAFGARTVVSAHSGLGAASPAPGSTVGGQITEVELRYASSVSDVGGAITGPSGATVGAEFIQESVLAVRIALAAPLSEPGEYTVRHISTSVEDGDRVEAAYLFTYDPDAPPPQLEVLDTDDGGTGVWVWIVLAVGLLVIALLAWRLVSAARYVRASPPDN